MKTWPHVFEPSLPNGRGFGENLRGTWGDRVILELACGEGAYTLGLAALHPDATVIGVDIKGSRIWHGAGNALAHSLPNARFLRTRIEDLGQFFAPAEVDEIWITFPDPHPRLGKEKKRLTSRRFLQIYAPLLKPGGRLHLKTDVMFLLDFTRSVAESEGWTVLEEVRDLYANEVTEPELQIQTPFEKKHLAAGRQIGVITVSWLGS